MRTMLLCLALVWLLAVSVSAEILVVPATNLAGVYSSPLTAGQLYDFTIVGTYFFSPYPNVIADAEWSDPYNWVECAVYNSLAADALDVVINDTPVDWLGTSDGITYAPHTFSPTHTYIYRYVGTGASVNFHVADLFPWGGDCTGDNSGFLTVDVTPVPEPSSLIAMCALLTPLLSFRRSKV